MDEEAHGDEPESSLAGRQISPAPAVPQTSPSPAPAQRSGPGIPPQMDSRYEAALARESSVTDETAQRSRGNSVATLAPTRSKGTNARRPDRDRDAGGDGTEVTDDPNDGDQRRKWRLAKLATQMAIAPTTALYYADENFEVAEHILKEPRFFQAAYYGDLQIMKKLFKSGAVDPNVLASAYFTGDSPLHVSCRNGHTEIASYVIGLGCKEHRRNNNGESALYLAAMNGHLDCAKIVAQKGAQKDRGDKIGRTPLLAASLNGHLDVVRYMVETGASKYKAGNDGKTPLFIACENGHLNIVLYLLQASNRGKAHMLHKKRKAAVAADAGAAGSTAAAIDDKKQAQKQADYKDQPSRNGVTPLAVACKHGHVEIVRYLLKHQCSREASDMEGNTPLMMTAMQALHADRQKLVVEALIESGAHINNKDTARRTALFKAAHCGNSDICAVLIKTNAHLQDADGVGMTPLHAAAANGHVDTVSLLLRHGARSEAQTEQKQTPILLAAKGGHLEVVQLLLQCTKKGTNTTDVNGLTPLYVASAGGHIRCVKRLLAANADVRHVKNEDKTCAFSVAALSGHTDVVSALLKAGQDVNFRDTANRTALYLAAHNGHLAVCEVLVDWPKCALDGEDEEGYSPLMVACIRGNLEVFAFLLESDCDKEHYNSMGENTLHKACQVGALDAVRLLVAAGAKKNKAAADTLMTPMMIAAANGMLEVVQYMIAIKSKVESRNSDRQTALLLACSAGHTHVVQHLLKCKANMTAEDVFCETPLVAASARGHLSVVECLVTAGADVNFYASGGKTALSVACEAGHVAIARFVLEHGAEVDYKLADATTALYAAAESGQLDVIECLLAAHANPTIPKENGWTSLHIAAFNGHNEVLMMLCETDIADLNPVTKNGSTPLLIAAQTGNADAVKLFCDIHGENQDQGQHGKPRIAIDACKGQGGPTALMIAAKHGHLSCAKHLTKAGSNKDLTTKCKNTALHIAAKHHQTEVLELLVEEDANPLINYGQESDGYTRQYDSPLVTEAVSPRSAKRSPKKSRKPLKSEASGGLAKLEN